MNSATNPRKFAEKIAKLHQKEQEQTQAFEQIMAEVIVATRHDAPNVAVPSKHHLHIHQSVAGSRAESLPNVNHVSRSGQNSIDLQSALSNLEQIKQGKSPGRERRHSPAGMLTPSVRGHSPRSAAHPEQRRASPASPYSTPYLSPPDTWRRTNSDSALHQSSILAERQNVTGGGYSGLQQQHVSRRSAAAGQMGSSSLTNISQAGDSGAQSTSESWDDRNRQYQVQMTTHPDMILDPGLRPKSCDVPGITIFPSQEDSCHNGTQPHIPLSANTGSLPDLSSFHFPAPLSNPIDPEELAAAAAHSSSTPASNSHSSSLHYPNPGSPYGTGRQQASSPFNSNPNSPFSPQSPLSALGYSPPGDTGQLTFENISHLRDSSVLQQAVRYPQYRGTAAPTITVEGLALDTSALSLDANHHYHMNSVQDSRSFNGGSAVDQQNLTYPSNCHQVHSGSFHDRNGPPSEHSNSAPSSPVAPQNHPASPSGPESVRLIESDSCFSSGFPTSVLQHQFEQFKMVNNFADPESIQMVQGSAGHSSSSSASSSTGGLFMTTVQAQQQHSHNRPDIVMEQDFFTISSGNGSSFGRTSDSAGHFATRNLPLSASSLMSSSSVPTLYSKSVISCAPSQYSQQQQRQVVHSPQTSDSIPEIVLTEPLSESDGLLRHDFQKDMGSAMGSFDASDLFSSDSFKSELPIDPIDFDGLQILTEMSESDERLERS